MPCGFKAETTVARCPAFEPSRGAGDEGFEMTVSASGYRFRGVCEMIGSCKKTVVLLLPAEMNGSLLDLLFCLIVLSDSAGDDGVTLDGCVEG